MPELPDLHIFSRNLHARLAGQSTRSNSGRPGAAIFRMPRLRPRWKGRFSRKSIAKERKSIFGSPMARDLESTCCCSGSLISCVSRV